MTERPVDTDDDLGDVTEALGSGTMKETANRALPEVADAALWRRHADRLETMEGLELADDHVMSGAWR